jgi:hypothetical protein
MKVKVRWHDLAPLAGALWLPCLMASCKPAPGGPAMPQAAASQPAPARARALIGGPPIDSESNGLVHVLGDVDCSGFLISNQWAMTARHCVSAALVTDPGRITVGYGGTRSQPSQITSVAEVIRSPPGWDLALLRLSSPLKVAGVPYGFQQRAYPNYSDYLVTYASQVICLAWGRTSVLAPPPEQPSMTVLTLAGLPPPLLRVHPSGGGGSIGIGDAGGFCLTQMISQPPNLLVGVIVGQDALGNGILTDLTRPEIRAWVEAALTIRDDDVAVSAASLPAAASPDGQEIDLYWVDAAGVMNRSQLQPDGPTVALGGQADDPFAAVRPAAVYVGSQLHIFGRTVSGRVLEQVPADGGSSSWTPVPSLTSIVSGLGAASWSADQLDVFASNSAQQIVHAWSDGTAWLGNEVLGGSSDTDVLAVSAEIGDLHVFSVVGGHVFHKWKNSSPWQPPNPVWAGNDLTGTVNSACSTVTTGTDLFDIFGRGANGHLVHKAYLGWWVDGFLDLGLPLPSEPTAVLAGARVDVFARNPDGSLWHGHLPR